MSPSRFFTTTSFAIVLAAGAFTGAQAQQTSAPVPSPQSDPNTANPMAAPTAPADPATAMTKPMATPPDTSTTSDPTVDTTTAVGVAPDGATLIAQAISNSPIPDTPANRAKYGQPLSHAGQQSDPAGN